MSFPICCASGIAEAGVLHGQAIRIRRCDVAETLASRLLAASVASTVSTLCPLHFAPPMVDEFHFTFAFLYKQRASGVSCPGSRTGLPSQDEVYLRER